MPTSTALSTAIAGLPWEFKQTRNALSVFIKNAVSAYIITSSTAAQITSANYPSTTVPGLVYLDDYMFVGAITGEIHNSSTGAVGSWGSLDFLTPEKEPSSLVAIAKSLNFLVAFKQWDTEFFYDNANPSPGSPLSTDDSSYLKLGCASAGSIKEFDGGIVFMSKRDQKQRSREIHILNGITPRKISTEPVERILNADDLADVRSLYLATAGHQFYVLTLVTSAITLVYDFNNGYWYNWTILTAQASQSVSSITRSGDIATVTVPGHGFNDGDPVLIAGADQSAYNTTFNIMLVDANTFNVVVSGEPTTPATGTITAVGYDESYFPFVASACLGNVDLVLHSTNGIVYALDPAAYDDNGVPINVIMRTTNWDGGTLDRKTISDFRLLGDNVSSYAMVRWSDDDYQAYSPYLPLDMSTPDGAIWRCGQTRKRAFEVRHTSTTPLRIEAAEFNAVKGR